MGQREYARHRKAAGLSGGTVKAVQNAIASGRLSKALTPDRKQIADAEIADAEWAATTRSDRIPITGPAASTAAAAAAGSAPPDLQESRARREAAEAALAEIELAEKRAELLPAHDVEARLVNVFSHCKTKLLGVPARARAGDPSLTADQITMFEALIREAIEDLASPDGPAAEG
jgi:hypothetical protein